MNRFTVCVDPEIRFEQVTVSCRSTCRGSVERPILRQRITVKVIVDSPEIKETKGNNPPRGLFYRWRIFNTFLIHSIKYTLQSVSWTCVSLNDSHFRDLSLMDADLRSRRSNELTVKPDRWIQETESKELTFYSFYYIEGCSNFNNTQNLFYYIYWVNLITSRAIGNNQTDIIGEKNKIRRYETGFK